ncbi:MULTISPECIES: hypothetical protein [Thermomonospora]|uniref:SAF domain protein n=1 Tax=Thermomonospora curvata (strain ATCC 19995 / DSM 43183 / JCM 3096 / KCTC 9072 / NBRC 15933 / NCIMB 10081 / Henssen B9) TaxID=471852 RepID=D1A219_THECD|nr:MULTISPECIES: hypothetical protein [Thermomonospora]ACY99672.1 hypothetical protein Tcur_4144 [Thermomonospora curvata DSM 43183]PKK12692.1 MAG: hypothetical protein BUE48_020335 [Thermomonospora sp. CIF 1]
MKASQSTVTSGSNGGPAGTAGLGRGGLGAATGQRLPVPPRERKPALAALAVLLILGGALTSAYLVIVSGQRVSAIQIAQPVAAGQQIPMSALREVQIGDTGIEYISWSERHKVVTGYAAVPLVAGALLTDGMVSPVNDAAQGRVVVGLALKPGQMPAAKLQTGQRVSVYAVGSGQGPGPRPGTLLSADAIVVGIEGGDDERLRGDQTMVDVAVPPADAPQLTQAASAGAVAVALVPEGTRVPQPGAGKPAGKPSNPPDPAGGQDGAAPPSGEAGTPSPGQQSPGGAPSGRTDNPTGG